MDKRDSNGFFSMPVDDHYINMIVVCLSVHLSVTGGQQKRFDHKKQEAVSLAIEQQRLQLGDLSERQ